MSIGKVLSENCLLSIQSAFLKPNKTLLQSKEQYSEGFGMFSHLWR